MADFCQECSIVMFGSDTRDLAGLLIDPTEYTDTMGALALCECCGPVVVDINGKRMSKDFLPSCDCAQHVDAVKARAFAEAAADLGPPEDIPSPDAKMHKVYENGQYRWEPDPEPKKE